MSEASWATPWPQTPPPPKHKVRVCFMSGMWVEFDIDDPKTFANMVNLIRSSGMLQTPTIYISEKVIAMLVLIGPDGQPVTKMEGTAVPAPPAATAPGSEKVQ